MAVTRKTIPADGSWTELTAGAAPAGPFQFSNTGTVSIMVRYQAALPVATDLGDLFKPQQGDRPDLATLAVRAWAKIEPGSPREGDVHVTV